MGLWQYDGVMAQGHDAITLPPHVTTTLLWRAPASRCQE